VDVQERKRKKEGCGKKRGAMCPHEHVTRTHKNIVDVGKKHALEILFVCEVAVVGMVVHSAVMRNG